tara:strand:- start:2811 stop:3401 length:591 start_codon:yes stop_codon:yes gene_type:complete
MFKHASKSLSIATLLISLSLFSFSIISPSVQSETSYFVSGLEDAILNGYEKGAVYEVNVMVRSDINIGGLNVSITNGSLSFSDVISEDDLHSLLVTVPSESGNYENWSFWWFAPSSSFGLGEGSSIFNIDFLVSDDNGTLTGDVALSSQLLVPPPPVSSDSGVVPKWAEDLAWFGALATLVLIVVSVLIFTRKEQS